jgi:hypothetical protein
MLFAAGFGCGRRTLLSRAPGDVRNHRLESGSTQMAAHLEIPRTQWTGKQAGLSICLSEQTRVCPQNSQITSARDITLKGRSDTCS